MKKKITASLVTVIMLTYFLPISTFAGMFPATNGNIATDTTINLSTDYSGYSQACISVASGVNLTLTSGRAGASFIIGSNTNITLNNAKIEDSAYDC